MSRDLKAPAAYMADLLTSLHYLSWPSPFVLVYLLLTATPDWTLSEGVRWGIVLLFNCVQLFYAWQLYFDALLFRSLAQINDDGSALDEFLLRQFNKAPRQADLNSRISGSQRLIWRYLLITALFYLDLALAAHSGILKI